MKEPDSNGHDEGESFKKVAWGGSIYRDGIFELLRSPEIYFKESIPPAYYSLAGRYDNPIPTRFLAPIHYSQIPAQYVYNVTMGVH